MPYTLLLADDSVTIQRVIELTFADEDVQVVAVSDGDQAIARLTSEPPDIVLADVGMPGRNGFDVVRHIRQTPHLAHIPVLLLTGAFEPVDPAKAAEAGCDGVLAKPFEPQLVIARVRELLTTARAPRGLAAGRAMEAAATQAPALPLPAANRATGDVIGITGNDDLDSYFDRLDAAFATMASAKAAAPERPSVADEIARHSVQPSSTSAAAMVDPRAQALTSPATPAASVAPASIGSSRPAPAAPPGPLPLPTAQAASIPAPPLGVPAPIGSTAPLEVATTPSTMPSATSALFADRDPSRASALESQASQSRGLIARTAGAPRTSGEAAATLRPPSLADAFAALLAAESGVPQPHPALTWPASTTAPMPPEIPVDDIVQLVLDRLSDRAVREAAAALVPAVAERAVREEIERLRASIQ
jgi:CheY-like chemotaxis protein